MHRRALLAELERYGARHPEDGGRVASMREFVTRRSDCFERSCLEGHVTGSAWIVSHDRRRVLLTHHRKLGRWLQLGGHADGDTNAARVALREAQEESGMRDFALLFPGAEQLPLDIDVHRIPARADEPAHFHHDVRYLLVAEPGQPLVRSDESNDLRWFDADCLDDLLEEESLLRMARRAREWLA